MFLPARIHRSAYSNDVAFCFRASRATIGVSVTADHIDTHRTSGNRRDMENIYE